ncbi:MAG: AI-2E family transporter [Firmicutes bacterium HGW-Firmicutes-20]|jgi:predicted PurR-regulated permease PerM|nr:MAG: AI-2E family transporter [Firmicutes bacterium HGW-Firmicutes-20]PKM67771.1 MAG: AI-2E family transporter [Firmicutes bacterium HGW-Firmicutes-19]
MPFKYNFKEQNNTLSLTIALILVLLTYFAIQNLPGILAFIQSMVDLLLPFIVGFAIAFLITPLMFMIESRLLKNSKLSVRSKRKLSAVMAFLSALTIFGVFIAAIVPQVLSSIAQLSNLLPDYVASAQQFLTQWFLGLNLREEVLVLLIDTGNELLKNLAQITRDIIPVILNFSWTFVSVLVRIVIGFIVSIYILFDRERFALQFKKLTYAIFSKNQAERLFEISKLTAKMFNSFIIGKTIDSIIVGIICYIVMILFGWPYPVLISLIIGVTNMIPVFGPFIGAIPALFLLFIVDPSAALWFMLFIIILQQIDGNIIGPLILQDSMGLPSLWIMFAIILGGGFFGLIGMFLGVPIFAVVYVIVKEIVNQRLKDKNIEC